MQVPVDGPNGERDFVAWGALAMWPYPASPFYISRELGVEIRGSNGTCYAAPGDWIVRTPSGEFIACTPSPVNHHTEDST
jgi:hypothetical protein